MDSARPVPSTTASKSMGVAIIVLTTQSKPTRQANKTRRRGRVRVQGQLNFKTVLGLSVSSHYLMIDRSSFRPAASRGTRRAPVASAVFPCLQKFGAREVSPRLPAPVSLQPFLAHRHPPLLTHPPRPSQWQRLSRRRLTKRLPSLPPPRRLRPRPRRPLQRLLSPPRRSSLRRRRRCVCSPNFGFYSYA